MSKIALVSSYGFLFGLVVTGCGANVTTAPPTRSAAAVSSSGKSPNAELPATLQFSDLIASTGEPGESQLARGLNGKRVRMVGFMVEMEQAPRGVFYLAPRPVTCDEAGGGTGDLPVESVLVSVPFMPDARIPHVAGALEVVGTFESGNQVDALGYASTFRLRVDAPMQREPSGPAPK